MKLLTQQCELTRKQESKHWREERRYDAPQRIPSYQQVAIAGAKVNLCARNPQLYKAWGEITKASQSKPRQTRLPKTPIPSFIESVRIGSHKEWIPNPYNSKHGFHRIVAEYKTVYHDCLVPKSWLEQHAKDHRDFIPTIEIQANGKTLSVNGNYKAGVIKEFVRAEKRQK